MSRTATLLAAVLLVFPSATHASDIIASASFSGSTRSQAAIRITALLRSDRMLETKIGLRSFGELPFAPSREFTRKRKLGKATFAILRENVVMLSNAESIKPPLQGVCASMPDFTDLVGELDVRVGYDEDSDAFTGDVERLVSFQHCSVEKRFLVSPESAARAIELQEKLRVLVTEQFRRRLSTLDR